MFPLHEQYLMWYDKTIFCNDNGTFDSNLIKNCTYGNIFIIQKII